MRWSEGRRSENVEDRRGMSPQAKIGGGVGTVVLIVVVLLMGGDPGTLIGKLGTGGGGASPAAGGGGAAPVDPAAKAAEDQLADFTSVVLADTEDTWTPLFKTLGRTYRAPKLVLFTGQVASACGRASASTGPFYCPGDHKVYIDLGFYRLLRQRLKAPGDFAQAYVIAHEVGHHVQNQLGLTGWVDKHRGQVSTVQMNKLSVCLELQADYLAGVWAHHAQQRRKILEPGDTEEALNAAAAIGDDRLQMQSRGVVVSESFTHGSSAQRVAAFRRGMQTGEVSHQALDRFFIEGVGRAPTWSPK